jgi:hypothetical protein
MILRGGERRPIGRFRRRAVKCLTVRPDEAERAVVERRHDDHPFMDEAIMKTPECDEIGQLRLPAVVPMLHVMAVHVTLEVATGEAAALVPRIQGSPDAGRNGPRLSANIERFALLVLDDAHEARIAGEPPDGLGIEMNDDLLAVGA